MESSVLTMGAELLVSVTSEYLRPDDDPALWKAASVPLVREFLNGPLKEKENFLQLGCCSHWLRPHQTRWTDAGGFAWPSGYGGNSGFSRWGMPEFDWSMTALFEGGVWKRIDHPKGRRPIILRIAVPNRTQKHNQAVMALRWSPVKSHLFLGWRKDSAQTWNLLAESEWRTE